MKPDNYNPMAREAFAKSLIDIGVTIFKGIILLFTVVPLVLIFKSVFDGAATNVSFLDVYISLSPVTRIVFLVLLGVSGVAGHLFRKEGLRHLHEIENVDHRT